MRHAEKKALKGKLAHNSMTSHLVFLSCLLGVVKALVEENNGNINIICAYRERKISSCAMSLEGNSLKIKKGIPGYTNPMCIKSKYE